MRPRGRLLMTISSGILSVGKTGDLSLLVKHIILRREGEDGIDGIIFMGLPTCGHTTIIIILPILIIIFGQTGGIRVKASVTRLTILLSWPLIGMANSNGAASL